MNSFRSNIALAATDAFSAFLAVLCIAITCLFGMAAILLAASLLCLINDWLGYAFMLAALFGPLMSGHRVVSPMMLWWCRRHDHRVKINHEMYAFA